MTATMEEQLCFEIKTILLAGHETSAAMLTWSLMELSRNPAALQKVHTGGPHAVQLSLVQALSYTLASHELPSCVTCVSRGEYRRLFCQLS